MGEFLGKLGFYNFGIVKRTQNKLPKQSGRLHLHARLEYDSFLADSLMYIATNVLLVVALLFAPDPMMGSWKADLNASVLPAGFPQLRSQTMVLQLVSGKLQCSTERVSLNGTKTRADFIAAFNGKRYPVKGIEEIATVSLRRYPSFIEADFFSATAPVYSYRMSISSKDDTLIIISIDPVTRATLHARIVYHRERVAMIFPPPRNTAASSINPAS